MEIKLKLSSHILEGNLKNFDNLKIDGRFFNSRLILGTASFPNIDVLNKSIEISESEIVTTSVRRLGNNQKDFFFDQINNKYTFLPNTAGCYTKKEAILTK